MTMPNEELAALKRGRLHSLSFAQTIKEKVDMRKEDIERLRMETGSSLHVCVQAFGDSGEDFGKAIELIKAYGTLQYNRLIRQGEG
jgi:hypothetical protein